MDVNYRLQIAEREIQDSDQRNARRRENPKIERPPRRVVRKHCHPKCDDPDNRKQRQCSVVVPLKSPEKISRPRKQCGDNHKTEEGHVNNSATPNLAYEYLRKNEKT